MGAWPAMSLRLMLGARFRGMGGEGGMGMMGFLFGAGLFLMNEIYRYNIQLE